MENLILDNIHYKEDTFLGKLHDGHFDKGEFNKTMMFLYNLSNIESAKEEKLKSACNIWEMSFLILQHLGSNSNPEDVFTISNIDNDLKSDVIEKIYYISNHFTFGKTIDIKFIFI